MSRANENASPSGGVASLATGANVLLRPLRDEDVATVNQWLRDSQTWGWVSTYPEFLPVSSADEVGDLAAMIELRRTGAAIGYCVLRCEESRNQAGVFDVVIGEPQDRGWGFGAEATALFLAVLFGRCGLRRVEARVAADNSKCLSAIRKFGFREEGLLRERYVRDGSVVGVHVFSLLSREFEQLRVVRRYLGRSQRRVRIRLRQKEAEGHGCRRPCSREERSGSQDRGQVAADAVAEQRNQGDTAQAE